MLATGTTTRNEDERAFLQERLALFTKWGFVLAISTDVIDLAFSDESLRLKPAWFLDRLVAVLLLGGWLISRSGKRSIAFSRGLDIALSLGTAITVSLMGRFLAHDIVPVVLLDFGFTRNAIGAEAAITDAYTAMFMMLGGGVMFAFRAAVLPSSPRLTFFVTGVLGLPWVLVPTFVAPAAEGVLALRHDGASASAASLAIWWSVVTAVCTAISTVIYGLRRDVRDARRLGQYTLVEKIGEGGMGSVYRARHARLRRATAIKLLPSDRLSEDAVARFESEVQLTSELTHPNTVTVFDYGRTDDGVFYYAMEYLDGASLAQVLAVDGSQPAARVVRILSQTASALQEAHGVGLVHRDIKPANIMLARQGLDHDAVKLVDFGLAKVVDREDDMRRTQDDRLVGTPLYMAPEAIRDANARSKAADIYSLGAVGYFLLTGTHVFAANTIVEVCAHHLHTEPTPPSARTDRKIPTDLEELVLSCLAKDPADRPASAADVVRALSAVRTEDTWTSEDAEQWWASHREELATVRRSEQLDGVQLTVNGSR